MAVVRTLLVVAGAGLLAGSPAAAQPVTRPDVPISCREAFEAEPIALACDTRGSAAGARLTLGARSERGARAVALDGVEPLQAGETVTLTWRHPSSSAVLAVKASAPDGPRPVVLDLRDRPRRVAVTANADGSLAVVTPRRHATVPPPPAVAPWQPRTARAAADGVLAAADRIERVPQGAQALCAALERDVFAVFEFALGDPRDAGCPVALTLSVFGDENVPEPIATSHAGSALAVRGGRAILRTTLTHRYRRHALNDPRRLRVRARILLVRAADGVWRLATIGPLLPLVAIDHRRPYTDAELSREYRGLAADGRKVAATQAARQAARDAATVASSPQPPCVVAEAADPPRDVTVKGSTDRARDQGAHADVDLVSFGVTGRCLLVRTAAPLPSSFVVGIEGDDDVALRVRVDAGRVLVEDTSVSDPGKPATGVAAYLEPNALVVALPAIPAAPFRITLGAERARVRYGDDNLPDQVGASTRRVKAVARRSASTPARRASSIGGKAARTSAR